MSRINSASAEVYNAEVRFKACPEFKRFVWKRLLHEVSNQRRVSVRAVLEEARKKDWTRTDGDPFRCNNNLAPAIARLFIQEYPHAKKYIELRRAACDGMEAFSEVGQQEKIFDRSIPGGSEHGRG